MNWKQALEDCPVKSSSYPYCEIVHADDQPQVPGIPGDIQSIQVDEAEEKGRYDILVTIIMQDMENLTEEELVKRLRALGADPNADWE